MRKLLVFTLLVLFTCSLATAVTMTTNPNAELSDQQLELLKQHKDRSRDMQVIFSEDFENGENGWATTDLTEVPTMWHVSDQYAYEGDSWWCGDEALGGYNNHWLQYLETPVWNLSGANAPVLSFMGKWLIEAPGGEPAGYDGWDTANMWISTDGGATWNPIAPATGPAYNVTSSYAFGYEFNMGTGIPGWGGASDWSEITVDLSGYATSAVQFRFAFCSDPAYSTPDDPSLFGFFVDNIAVTDGATELFSNDGVDNGDLTPTTIPGSGDFWVLTDESANSPTHSWNLPDGNPNVLNALVSPWIDIPANATGAHFDFWLWCNQLDFDGDGDNSLEDYYHVEVTTDEINWEVIFYDYGDVDRPGGIGWQNYLPGLPFNGNLEMDLSAFIGQSIKLRWRVTTDGNDDGGTGQGLFIDDVTVYADIFFQAPSNLMADADDNDVTLTWDPVQDAVSYNVYHRLGTGGTYNLVENLTATTTTVMDVPDGINYFYVTAVDAGGTESGPSNVVQVIIGDVLPPTAASAVSGLDGHVELSWVPPGIFFYEEDFEASNGNYVSTGAGWEWGTPTSGPGNAHSGSYVWGTLLGGEYPSSANFTLDSPAITVEGSAPQLTYWTWYDTEFSWDGWNVKISTDGGTNFTILYPTVPAAYDDDAANAGNAGIPDEPCFSGHDVGEFWQQHVFDLSDYAGDEVIIRWHFGSDSSINFPGVFIDDVFVGDQMVTLTRELEGYHLFRSLESGVFEDDAIATVGADVTEYTDWGPGAAGLDNGTTYYYCVKADFGADGISGCATAMATPQNHPPATPTGFTGSAAEGVITLDWDDNVDYDFDHYNVYHRLGIGGEFALHGSPTASDYVIDPATEGDNYFRIVAVDNGDPGLESDPTEALQFLIGAIPPTTAAATSGRDGYVELGWVAPGVFFYEEDFEADDGGYVDTDTVDDGWTWGTPAGGPGGAYSGTYAWGTVLAGNYGTDCNYMLDSAPITVAGGDPYLTFMAWYDTEANYDGWNVKISTNGGTTWSILNPTVPSAYPVAAINTDNMGIPGEPGFSGHDIGESWQMYAFSLADYAGQEVMIRWHLGSDWLINYEGVYIDDVYIGDVDELGNRDLAGYILYRSTTPNVFEGDPIATVDASITEYVDWGDDTTNPYGLEMGLTNGTTYYYCVKADYGVDGISGCTTAAGTPANAAPPAPQNLTASDLDRIVTLTWDAVDTYDMYGYNVWRSRDGGEFAMINAELVMDTTYDDDLTAEYDGVYQYKVTAMDYYEDNSAPSAPVNVLIGLLSPTYPGATGDTDGYISLRWAVPGLLGGEVEDFEADDGGYDADNSDGSGWAWGAPTSGPNEGYDGSVNVWATNLAGQYSNSANYQLNSAPIIVAGTEPYLQYMVWHDIENGYDGFNVKLSPDGGSTWMLIDPVGGYPNDSITGLGEPGFTDVSDGWVMHAFDLSAYVGQEVMVKWHFGSDSSVQRIGAYIDNVVIGDLPTTRVDALTDYHQTIREASDRYLLETYGNVNAEFTKADSRYYHDWFTANVEMMALPGMVNFSITRALQGYKVYRSDSETAPFEEYTYVDMVDAATMNYVDWGDETTNPYGLEVGLTNGTTYYYAIVASYDEGDSGPSPIVSATPVNEAPPAPVNLMSTNESGAVTVTWDPVDTYDMHGYNIFRKVWGGEYELMNTALLLDTTFSDDLTDDVDGVYLYAVTAEDYYEDNSDYSDWTMVLQGNIPPTTAAAVSGMDGHIEVSWVPPGVFFEEREWRYDDGNATAQLGAGSGQTVLLGSAHYETDCTIEEISWYLTDQGGEPHTTAQLMVLGLDSNGVPDATQIVHESGNVPNVDNQWNTYVLPEPLEMPNGFYIGVKTPGVFVGLGTDDGVGEPYVFMPGTQWASLDYPTNVWDDIGEVGFPFNFTIRAYGTVLPSSRTLSYDHSAATNINHHLDSYTLISNQQPVFTGTPDNSYYDSFRINRDVVGYEIYRGILPGNYDETPIAVIDDPAVTQYDDWGPDLENLPDGLEEGLFNGMTYYYCIKASYGVDGMSECTVTSGSPENAPPTTPEGLSFIDNNRVVTLLWSAVNDYDIWVYEIFQKVGMEGEFVSIGLSETNSFDVDLTDPEDDGLYFFKVRAVDYYNEPSTGFTDQIMVPIGLIPPSELTVVSDPHGRPMHLTWNHPTGGGGGAGVSGLTEGFEEGIMPPTDWTVVDGPSTPGDNPAHWTIDPAYLYEGAYGAACYWGYNLDEWLITPAINMRNVDNPNLHFAWEGSYYWSVDPNDNADFFIQISTDDGATWEPIWTFGEIGVWENWIWYEEDLDLSAYENETILIGFNVVGNDNADTALDAIVVNDGARLLYSHSTGAMNQPRVANLPANAKSIAHGLELLAAQNIEPIWTVPSVRDNDDDVVLENLMGYRVYRKEGLTGTYEAIDDVMDPEQTWYDDNNVIEGTLYCYKVAALYETSLDESAFTNESCDVPVDAMAPAVPTGFWGEAFCETNAMDTYVLYWTNPMMNEDDEPLVDLAKISIWRNGVHIDDVLADNMQGQSMFYEDELMTLQPPYVYHIHAHDYSNNTSIMSEQTTLGCAVSVEMASLTAAYDNETVIVRWETSQELNHLGFNVYRSEVAGELGTQMNEEVINGSFTYSFTDATVQGETTYYYTVADVNAEGQETHHGPVVVTTPRFAPKNFALNQNFPNPFNPATVIAFAVKEPTHVKITVFNMAGQVVRTLVNDHLDADFYEVRWDGTNDRGEEVSSGQYFYSMNAGDFSTMKRMTFVK